MQNVHNMLICLKSWSPGAGTVGKIMEPLVGRGLLEGVCHWGVSVEILLPESIALPSGYECTMIRQTPGPAHHTFPACCNIFLTRIDSIPLELQARTNSCSLRGFYQDILSQQQKT